MKRKILFISLVATLSTLGYAGNIDIGDIDPNKVAIESLQQQVIEVDKKVDGQVNELSGKLDNKADVDFVNQQTDKVFNDLNAQKVDKSEFNDLQSHVDAIEADKDALRDEMNANKQELNDKIDANKNELNNKIDKNNAIIQGEIDRVDGKTDALNNRVDGIVQSNKVENDKQNNRLDKVETENKNQNTAIEGLQSQTNHNSEKIETNKQNIETNKQNIETNKQNIETNKQNIETNKQNIETNKQNIEANKNAIDKETADRVAADQEIMNNIEKYNGQYEARMNAMDKKIDNLDEKMNKGLSLMAAMNAVDFQDVQEGEMAIGAGVGHYGNAQSVAVGVAYSPSQNLNVNMKYSVTAGDVDSFAVGAGASYKFRVK